MRRVGEGESGTRGERESGRAGEREKGRAGQGFKFLIILN